MPERDPARRFNLPARPVSALLCLLLLGGCNDAFQNGAFRAKEQADKKFSEGEYGEAITFYEAALDGTPKSAEIHYQIALIYDEKLKQPLDAVHHYQRCLALAPNGPHTKDARNFIKEDEMKLRTALASGALLTQENAVKLKNDNLALRKQLTELRAMPRYAQKGGFVPGGSPGQIPPGATTYVVQPGDTLASISRHFFKSPERWKDIQDANFNALGGTVKLKVGMTLIIPK